jgi:uncharacterized membrane protein YgcG
MAARVSAPRLQMSLLVLLTAAAGFLASVALSAAGMDALWLRYPLCVMLAYIVFLGLICVWRRYREWDASGLSSDGGSSSSAAAREGSEWQGAGGQSGGAGASADFDALPDAAGMRFDAASADVQMPALESALDLDESLPVAVVLALLAGALLAVGWVIWIAPALLAELALDAVLSAGLYRRLKYQHDPDRWLVTTLRGTAWPFVAATLSLLLAGVLMNLLVPDATSLSGFLAHYR